MADIRVLIIGGYGVFGGRLARVLAREARFHLIVAGRSGAKAQAFVRTLEGPAVRRGAAVDITGGIDQALRAHQPDLVVHCAGPFQGQDYRVVEACIEAGVHYTDLSDGRAFTQGFSVFDNAAKSAGVFAITAASTTSALSSAASLELANHFSRIDALSVGVTPGNRAPRGLGVVKAILGYAGEPIPQLRGRAMTTIHGWGDLKREILPGLGRRWFSACDAPDMVVLPALFPQTHDIAFRAGLELSVLHLAIWGLAQLRRKRIIPNLARFAPALHAISRLFAPFGSDQGGMFVEMSGADPAGRARRARWTLWAGSGDGPYIPALAAAAIARKLSAGNAPPPGARACAGEVTLGDFEREFAMFRIKTQTEIADDADALSEITGRGVRDAA